MLYFIVELGAHLAQQLGWLSDYDTCDSFDVWLCFSQFCVLQSRAFVCGVLWLKFCVDGAADICSILLWNLELMWHGNDNDTCDAWDFVMSGYVSHGFCFAVQSPLCVGNLKWHFCRSSRIFLLLSVKRSWGQFQNRLITRVAHGEVVAVSGSVDQSGSELKFSADEAAEVCSVFVCETWAYVARCWDDYELQVDNSLPLFDWIEFENGCHALVALQVTS